MLSAEILQLLMVKRWGEAEGGTFGEKGLRGTGFLCPLRMGPASGRKFWAWRRVRLAPEGAPLQGGGPDNIPVSENVLPQRLD